MFSKYRSRSLALVVGLALVACAFATAGSGRRSVHGVVYRDVNRNGRLDPSEQGIPGVCVSNGVEVVQTGAKGAYSLPARDEMVVFVVKPSGYATPLDENNVPQFYYVHRPDGSPASITEYEGLSPTGPLPESVNLPLYRSEKRRRFSVLVFGDTQVGNNREVGYLRDAFISELSDTDAALAITLGDNVDNNLAIYPRYLSVMGGMGIPTYYTPGNHDMNRDAKDRRHNMDTFTRLVGPTYYSFNVGRVHFVVLNDIAWNGQNYHGELGGRQRRWLENDLSKVPEDRLVVLTMHIPIFSWFERSETHSLADRKQLYRLLEDRRALALIGHIHTVEHFRAGQTVRDWEPIPFPQVLAGAVCGSWWSGPKDESGVPTSYQREGAPKGYMVFEFDGADYRARYRVPGSPADYQMNISLVRAGADSELPAGVITPGRVAKTTVLANVFCGDGESEVWCRVDGGKRVKMERNTGVIDPFANRAIAEDHRPVRSSHLWTTRLPADLQTGIHALTVSAEDMYGQVHRGVKLFEVRSKQAVAP